MIKIRVCNDLGEAQKLWQQHWPVKCLFDIWEVRACFQNEFNFMPFFLVATQNRSFGGMIGLSWIDDTQSFGHFPGELWQEKTWLEQNKILAGGPKVLEALLDHIPPNAEIRYLDRDPNLCGNKLSMVDEVSYLFFPRQYDFSLDTYLQSFSGKSRKKIGRELDQIRDQGVSFRYDHTPDIAHLFQMNLDNFKEYSYFSDDRFLMSFENLISWLYDQNMLRVTTVLVGGRIAAVDIGAVWKSTYTVLAGGAHRDFPGIAKLINLQHMEWACQNRFSMVDFLCGDFSWKSRFHLTPRRLYKALSYPGLGDIQDISIDQRASCAA